jgi:hypothetical protein
LIPSESNGFPGSNPPIQVGWPPPGEWWWGNLAGFGNQRAFLGLEGGWLEPPKTEKKVPCRQKSAGEHSFLQKKSRVVWIENGLSGLTNVRVVFKIGYLGCLLALCLK